MKKIARDVVQGRSGTIPGPKNLVKIAYFHRQTSTDETDKEIESDRILSGV
jgi:hypothetical protein